MIKGNRTGELDYRTELTKCEGLWDKKLYVGEESFSHCLKKTNTQIVSMDGVGEIYA